MEKFIVLLIPALAALAGIWLITIPMRLIFKLGIHGIAGFLCLLILNSIAGFTGVLFPINLITVLIAGILGIPGIAVMAMLAIL